MSTGSSVTTVGAGPVPWTRAWDALAPAQRLVIGVAATAAGYYGLARLGFVVQYPGEVSAVWLPVGFAVAMLSLGDMRWLVGALLADLLLDVTPGGLNWGPAVTQTVGNMVEVAVGAMLVRAVIGPRRRLERPNQALALVGALMVAAALSATIGDLALGVANVVPWHEIPVSWRTWWLADTCGGLTIVPLALAWTDRRAWWGWTVRQRAEALMLLAAVVVLSVVAFRSHHPLTYAVFPALMVATLRLGLPAGTVGVAVAAAYAVGSTADNLGPFVVRSIDDQALNTQLYVLVAALTVLMLGTLVVAGERSAPSTWRTPAGARPSRRPTSVSASPGTCTTRCPRPCSRCRCRPPPPRRNCGRCSTPASGCHGRWGR
ncbi:MAG: MASE1 domain-containing protein [Thermoleophilia bacterium]